MKKLLIGIGLIYLSVQLGLMAIDRLVVTNRTTRLIERHHTRRLEVGSASDR